MNQKNTNTSESFQKTLAAHDKTLCREKTNTLQINVGFKCNQACTHCHLEAGPQRTEMMAPETMAQVVVLARHPDFTTIDITGGAPELHPRIGDFIKQLTALGRRTIFRANLTALAADKSGLLDLLADQGVVVTASFPSLNPNQTESLRGKGVFSASLDVLKKLNQRGYGQPASGLELDLVVNPAGAFLPPTQESTEKRFKKTLKNKWGIDFNNLYSFANVPLGRFRKWLQKTGNFENYMAKLTSAFNPCAVDGLMCKQLVSVAWDGFLYDCDFNLAIQLDIGGLKTHISQTKGPPQADSPIAVGDHCYTCTAGAGFT